MTRWGLSAAVAVLLTLVLAAFAAQAGAAQRPSDRLDAYTAVVSGAQFATISEAGFDVFSQSRVAGGTKVGLVLTRGQRDKLAQEGIDARLTRVKGGQTVKQFAARQAANGFQVWRSWDEPGGFRDQMYAAARDNPQIAKLVRLGTTVPGPRDPGRSS